MSLSDLQRQILSKKFPPLPSKPLGTGLGQRGPKGGRTNPRKDYSPLSWEGFFDKKEQIRIDESNVFNCYFKGDSGPVLLLLHGGGYSGLTWALVA